MGSNVKSSSRTVSEEANDLEETFDGLTHLTEVPLSFHDSPHLGLTEGEFGLLSSKEKASRNKVKVSRISPRSPEAAATAQPPFWAKFEATSSFNCPSVYASISLDLGLLSEYCSFDDGYAVFSP